MYKQNPYKKTTIKHNTSYIGETIEQKVKKIVNNKEPITDGAPLIYTERKDGVLPGYNIRTDRMEIALDAMEAVNKAKIAKRADQAKVVNMQQKEKKNEITGGESIQGTDNVNQ